MRRLLFQFIRALLRWVRRSSYVVKHENEEASQACSSNEAVLEQSPLATPFDRSGLEVSFAPLVLPATAPLVNGETHISLQPIATAKPDAYLEQIAHEAANRNASTSGHESCMAPVPDAPAHQLVSVLPPVEVTEPAGSNHVLETTDAMAAVVQSCNLLLPDPTPAVIPAALDSASDKVAIPAATTPSSAQGTSNALAVAAVAAVPAELKSNELKPPPRYRPRLRERPDTVVRRSKSSSQPGSGKGVLDADMTLSFQAAGWGITMSLLLRRAEDMPEEIAVRVGGENLTVLAIDASFFEPLPLLDSSGGLANGFAVESVGMPRRRWVRSQRSLHVFSERPGISGFTSVPRAVIGQENVILCVKDLGNAVLDYCEATGADALIEVKGPGVSEGWRCFRSYRPKRPVEFCDTEEIMLALNPLPHAVIELLGGISVSRSSWIADRPPAIRIVGVEPTEGEVKIDGKWATFDGVSWTAPEWNRAGQHTVRYAGLSRSYEIIEPENTWPSWQAHAGTQFSVCGAAVSGSSGERAIVLSMPCCWLLGAEPRQVAWAAPSVYGSVIAAPAFQPVWAIFPRRGRMRQAPRLLTPDALPSNPARRTPPVVSRQWRELIRDAQTHLDEPEADLLWQLYRRAARALR